MILQKITSFDDEYKALQKNVSFNDDLRLSSTIMKLKNLFYPFLTNALLDCYSKYNTDYYIEIIISDRKYLNWFKEKHTKKEFIEFISLLDKEAN